MNLRGRSFLRTQDYTRDEIEGLLQLASDMKRKGHGKPLAGKSLACLFFNPSLRTRSSFDLAMYQLGGHAVALHPGRDAWAMEAREGVVMDGEAEEHLKEGTTVLSRFFDAIAVRSFPMFQNWAEEKKDPVLTAIAKWSSKPVLNMETIVHPCQELALALTLREHLQAPARKKFLLTWTSTRSRSTPPWPTPRPSSPASSGWTSRSSARRGTTSTRAICATSPRTPGNRVGPSA